MEGAKKILLFGGTTEGRRILASGLPFFYSVATEYGAELAAGEAGADVCLGRMDAEEMRRFLEMHPVAGVIDATHPYAVLVSRNIRLACESTGVPRIRVLREPSGTGEGDVTVPSCEAAAEFLLGTEGNVLLTVGSKELACFTRVPGYRQRCFARVLPTATVLAACEDLGFDAGHVLAMQGPFSQAMNAAMLEATKARILVTKDGGAAGGFDDKIAAARAMGVRTVVVGRPREFEIPEPCHTVEDAVTWARGLLQGQHREKKPFFPLFMDFRDKAAVVIGGGRVALRRSRALLTCGARVRVVSPVFDRAFDQPLYKDIKRVMRRYRDGDLHGAFLAVAATDDRQTNRRVGMEARARAVPVSVADSAEECTFFFPALIAEGEVVAAISAGGAPRLSRHLAARLREVWPAWVEEAWQAEKPTPDVPQV